ncbi:RhoGAP domain-containing protein [Thecamonas trahens ATCC 50062]|uniref:RhoGAP domain-containing protein n=1 Tax=Thecamonas trahens ATCC 50062 TaxID=461836 RepID=A0A0L0DCP7_THETB|nr:RhoGAP domain-containing protein [Thecamonas trahens ATCC 50062]KNC49078.1 RhoGAP domain-containing protein [Thecamonas trahens ATCC 50062]|eukprot:XP_013758109.1 RhoGAP domain-containing protein [Thecamonas trahens ATCC 50062]
MSESARKAIERYLRPEETVVIACEAKFLKKTSGKMRARMIALVQSGPARKRQSAVMTLKSKRFSQPILKGVYPITPAFRCKGLGGDKFSISYEGVASGEEYVFEISRVSVKEMLVPMMTALKAAREAGAVALDWLSYYAIVDQPDNEPELAMATASGAGPVVSSAAASRAGPSAGSESESDDEEGAEDGGDDGGRLLTVGGGAGSSGAEMNRRKGSVVSSDGGGDDELHNPLIGTSGRALSNPDAVMDIKEQWIQEQMLVREDEFTDKVPFRLFVGTWNVNGKKPGEELDPWLCAHDEPSDIYAVGFQELDLSAEAFLLNNTTRSAPWEQHIEQALSKHGDYVLITSKQLVGILLCVYVRTEFLPYISDVQTDVAGVGVMGVMGNKGGVAIRFRFHDSRFCFVNSHLAARMGNVARRNQDHKEICRRLAFQVGGASKPSGAGSEADSSARVAADSGRAYGIFDHDYLFWLGDLNYRISTLADAQIKAHVAAEEWDALLEHDQLMVERRAKRTFVGFAEGQIDFKPTYKYDPGTSRFDTSEKKRSPAWCDRVLWIARRSVLNQHFYGGHHELLTSDHKPVSAVFTGEAKIVVKERKALIYHSVVRELDQLENESMPDATLSSSTFDFGTVHFKEPLSQSLVVHNNGQVMIHFSFIPKPGDTQRAYCKPWLSIEPERGLLMPGKSAEVMLTLTVDNEWGTRLNLGEEELEDILILHLENGKDYFVNVRGEYAKSAFGASLDHLCRLAGPIAAAGSCATPDAPVLSVPKELWWLADYLYTHSTDDIGLFQESGDEAELATIRSLLDSGQGLLAYSGSIHSVAEALLKFLACLATPVIPFRMLPRAIEAAASPQAAIDLVGVLPAINYNVFTYLMAFLRELTDLSPSLTPHASPTSSPRYSSGGQTPRTHT